MPNMYLGPGHGLWVHCEQPDGGAQFLQCSLEQLPQGGLATATGAHDDHSHSLTELLTQLYGFADLIMFKEEKGGGVKEEGWYIASH